VAVLNILQRALEHLPVRGKGRFAEQILRHAKTETLKCSPFRGLEIHLRRSQRIERLMWAGAYERKLVVLLKRIVKPSMTVLDVGANIGYIAAIAAGLAGQGGCVHAFDPNPDCYARLKLNLDAFPAGPCLTNWRSATTWERFPYILAKIRKNRDGDHFSRTPRLCDKQWT
jgi:hypothetical protein